MLEKLSVHNYKLYPYSLSKKNLKDNNLQLMYNGIKPSIVAETVITDIIPITTTIEGKTFFSFPKIILIK